MDKFIGVSDISSLVLRSFSGVDGYPAVQELFFGGDGGYMAHIVKGGEVKSHYKLVYSCERWLKVYDDENCTCNFRGKRINVYRAGMFGCTIEIIN